MATNWLRIRFFLLLVRFLVDQKVKGAGLEL